ncbi:hypothetical protein C8Q78DRAFT_1165325, partial [Trametes maxima]
PRPSSSTTTTSRIPRPSVYLLRIVFLSTNPPSHTSLNSHGPHQGQLKSHRSYRTFDIVADDVPDSKPLASPLEERHLVSSLLPRPPGRRRRRLPPAVSRSPIASGPERLPSVKFGATRSRPSCSSASCPSSVSFVRLPRTSRRISASSRPPSWHSRRLLRPTSSPCSRTPTWLPFTPSV